MWSKSQNHIYKLIEVVIESTMIFFIQRENDYRVYEKVFYFLVEKLHFLKILLVVLFYYPIYYISVC